MEGVIKYQVLFAATQTLRRSSPSPPKTFQACPIVRSILFFNFQTAELGKLLEGLIYEGRLKNVRCVLFS